MSLPVTLRPASLPFSLLVSGLMLLPYGCRASERVGADGLLPPPPPPPVPPAALHWPVPAPRPLGANDPVLWVALAAQLGSAALADGASAAPVRLVANAGVLTLTDATGQTVSGPELVLHWRREPLERPLRVRRRVMGPFASFESAETVADRWAEGGTRPEIAKPREWELWAPPDAGVPQGMVARLEERVFTHALLLEYRDSGGKGSGARVLQGPIRLSAPGGLRWRGGAYTGPFRLQGDSQGTWSLVEEVPLEHYLEGVVPHEIGAGSPAAALEAQAVLARTWAVRNRHRFSVDGYHLCADTQCQVYSDPRQAGTSVRQAIAITRHRVLTWQGDPIHAVYHASNGGLSAGFEEAWSGPSRPYLRAFADGPSPFPARFPLPLQPEGLTELMAGGGQAYGADHPMYRWQRRLTAEQIAAALGRKAVTVGEPMALNVLERGVSGRVLALEVRGTLGQRVLRLDEIRRTLRQLPSTLFTVKPSGPGVWRVEGGGFGHGAGLSQAGAIDQARRGWSSLKILQHYYPGTELKLLRELDHST